MKRTHILKATVREWTDETGTKRKHRVEAGALFLSKDGAIVVKVDLVPTNPKWSGYFAAEPCAPTLPPGRRQPKGFPPPP